MPLNVFFASLATETNSFSSLPTAESAFLGQRRGAEVFDEPGGFGVLARRLRALAQAEGGTVTPSLFAYAQPAGPTVQLVYERLRDVILDDLRVAGAIDMVILFLHGAMMAQDCWDCEGDILARVRAIVGPDVPVGVVLDPHAHLTDAMLKHATVLCFQKEYPHTDSVERLEDAFRICLGVLRGAVKPTLAVHDCHMVGFWFTQDEPMRGFVDSMTATEQRRDVLSISFVHGFPWGDTPVTGARMLVYTNGSPAAAKALADDFGQQIWRLRHQTQMQSHKLDDVLARMAAPRGGLLVVADVADNAGGGAPSDSTFLARAILERGLTDVGVGGFYDPQAVALCHDCGLGAQIDLRVGGKLGPSSGQPLDLRVTVRGLARNLKQTALAGVIGVGDAAWIEAEGVHLILISRRIQCLHPDLFSGLGLDPTSLRSVVVKSTNHFRAGFDPIAAEVIYAQSPGALTTNFASIPYQRLTAPFWPKVVAP